MISHTAIIAESAEVAKSASVWDFSQIRENASVGENSIVGLGAYIGSGVKVGSNCKIQNYALVYEPAVIENGVFIGPAAIITNDKFPRAINEDGTRKSATDWRAQGVTIREGASIGAGAICVAPIEIGRWSMIAAGAVVVHNVPSFALIVGVPSKQIGWVGKCGHRLTSKNSEVLECAIDETEYRRVSDSEVSEI
jgi:UDP-2-acetamido-3-amino-2,3-dideoxy-glucuronate N-acetyltransferase